MNVHKAIEVAVQYLFISHTVLSPEYKGSVDKWHLNRELQYLLCHAFERLEKHRGSDNITDADIHMLVEAWIMGKGTRAEPLVRLGTPENL
jgi:hypothetical protein